MGKRLKKGFYWRGSVIWCRTDPITGKPRSTGCHSQSAADLWLGEREKLAASPTYAASLTATVGKWIGLTIQHKKANGKSDGTIHMYETKLGHVSRIFGKDSPMAVITPSTVDGYIEKRREEGAKANTIARELSCLSQMIRLARREGEYGRAIDEVMPVGFSPEYEPVKRTLRQEDLPTLLASLNEDQRAWVCYAIATGGDVGELAQARAADYDPTRRVVLMRGRKTKHRNVEIPILDMFTELFEYAHERLPLKPWPRVSKDLPEITSKLGIGHVSPKDLRRSAGSWLLEAGATEEQVSRFLRHGSTVMVRKVYGQVRAVALGRLIDSHTGAKTSQFDGPLAESGRRRGFKRLGAGGQLAHLPALRTLSGRPAARRGTSRRTESLHGNALRKQRLLLLRELNPAAAAPGLAICRGLDAAMRGDMPAVRRALERATGALGLAAGGEQ